MIFKWDEKKNKHNILKHGIDFRDIPDMFQYPMLTHLDTRDDYNEDRWIGIGRLQEIIVVIVFIEPEEDTIRIISARKATSYEQKKYTKALSH